MGSSKAFSRNLIEFLSNLMSCEQFVALRKILSSDLCSNNTNIAYKTQKFSILFFSSRFLCRLKACFKENFRSKKSFND